MQHCMLSMAPCQGPAGEVTQFVISCLQTVVSLSGIKPLHCLCQHASHSTKHCTGLLDIAKYSLISEYVLQRDHG